MSGAEFDRLLSWAQSQGVVLDGVHPAYTPEGWRGILATADLPADHVVLSVPEHLLMSTRSAARDPELSAVLQRHPRLSDRQVLMLHLLHEASKGESSFWAAYIQQLPRAYTLLEGLADEQVQQLQVPFASAQAQQSAARLQSEWEGLRGVLEELFHTDVKWRGLKAWTWASGTISSRTMCEDPQVLSSRGRSGLPRRYSCGPRALQTLLLPTSPPACARPD